ncbi:hypothetical protein L5F50_01280 [Aliarcobacter butzleri]|nr:hypothetical protein [Aliarcobacter butzleri]
MKKIVKKDQYYIKKPSKIKIHSNNKYNIESLLCAFSINKKFEILITTLFCSNERYHSKKFNKNDFDHLKKNIIIKLYSYGFSYSQICNLLLWQVSKKTISIWVNNKNEDIKRKPIQFKFFIKIKKEDLKNKDEETIKNIIKNLLSTEIEIFSFDGKKSYSPFQVNKIKKQTRKVILKSISPNGNIEPRGITLNLCNK